MPALILGTEQQYAREAKPLARARVEATQKYHYDSQMTQEKLSKLVHQHCEGKRPYEWQLDVAEALLLGVDSVVIAGTGMGKTLPFVMPLLFNPKSHMLIISPLKALQHDQVGFKSEMLFNLLIPVQQRRFRKMGISAIEVNDETWSPKVKEVSDKIPVAPKAS